ncbi:hypothetical protein GCM10009529_24000 [Micropruina glycogenica]
MHHDTDAARPDEARSPAVWLFRLEGATVRWDWRNGPPDLIQLEPWRRPKARAMSRHTPTHAYSQTTKTHLAVESGIERELVEELDGDPHVSWMVTQPLQLQFREGPQPRLRHVPDLLVVEDGRVVLWDVRPLDKQNDDFQRTTQLTRTACEEVEWDYRVFAGHPPISRINHLWISAYRIPSLHISAYTDLIKNGCQDGTIRTVGDVAARDSGYGQLTSAMWHLIWCRRLACNLDAPITPLTALTWQA